MNTNQAKQIDLVKFLARLGYHPIKEKSHNLWYKSPFRDETEASFKIDMNTNRWHDFGNGKKGTIVDFVAELNQTTNISEVLVFIKNNANTITSSYTSKSRDLNENISFFQKQKENSTREVSISPLTSAVLKIYLNQREISENYLPHLQQATIIQGDKQYLALAFLNDKGGYELNNKYYKGCTSKDLTTIHKDYNKPVFVFEAFLDCLSFFEICKQDRSVSLDFITESNFLVLNSVSLVEQGISALKPYSEIRLFLDNDNAGALTSQEMMRALPLSKDCSHLYKGYKDLNEFLVKSDKLSFEGFLSRCAIVLTKTNVLLENGDLAFTPEGRKREAISDEIAKRLENINVERTFKRRR